MLNRITHIILGCLLILAGCEPPPCTDGWVGAPPPDGTSLYCVRKTEDGQELRHGPYTRWHINGKMSAQGQYQDGKEEGDWIYWFDNGQVREQGSFYNGKPEGRWTSYYPDGSLWKRADYQDGQLHGVDIKWSKNGDRSSECRYQQGLLQGTCKRWGPDGNLIFSSRYRKGKPEGVVMNRTFQYTSYCNYKNGVRHGRCEVIFDREGVTVVVPYKNDNVDGRLDAFSADGIRLGETYFLDGKLHGRSVMWYQDGTLMESGYFEDGQAQGVWTFWQSSGEINSQGSFDQGKREGSWLYHDWRGEAFEVYCEKGKCPGFYSSGPAAMYIPRFLDRLY